MKQILLINDVVGCSNVGMVAMLPILTYLGHAAYNLPTSLVSNTLDYGKFSEMDTTDYMRRTLPVWRELGFHFDAVCTGLMFSEQQARLVADFCEEQRAGGTTIFVDPIMGDAGRLYNGIDEHSVELNRRMVSVADLIFPNYTEACYLTGIPYRAEGMTQEEAHRLLDALVALGTRSAIITSFKVDGKSCVVGRRSEQPLAGFAQQLDEGPYFCLDYDEIPVLFHGTGDVFSAVLMGHLLNGSTLRQSTRTAMDVVSSLIEHNRNLPDKNRGIPIVRCLDLLGSK